MKKKFLFDLNAAPARFGRAAVLLTALILLCRMSANISPKDGISSVSAISAVNAMSEIGISNNSTGNHEVMSREISSSENSKRDLRSQISELVSMTSKAMEMKRSQILVILELAETYPKYDSTDPDIFNEETTLLNNPPLMLAVSDNTIRKAGFVECENTAIERPSRRYLPDALYSAVYDLKKLTEERHSENIESESVYYNSLTDDNQNTIDFYEAVLSYIGGSEKQVNSFKNVYEKILTDKDANENVIEIINNKPYVRDKFRHILEDADISDENLLRALAIMFSRDNTLFRNDNIDKLTDAYVYPYEIGIRTRENMMTAAMSLVGDVRYVWGGGHSGASYIKGINPVWKQFQNLYPKEPYSYDKSASAKNAQTDLDYNEGFRTCIKPSGSWCPIHGYSHKDYHGENVYSIDQYIKLRSGLFDKIDLTDDKYRDMLSTVNYSHGVNAHVIDGLDCSGYVSWLFNQIQNDYNVNTAARYFISQSCFTPLVMGAELLPGDIFAWETHIVVIVGRVREGSNAYVTLEETPNVLRFGVAYYSNASSDDISYGKKIAAEANSLIGGINPDYEKPHVYCINTVGKAKSSNSVNSVSSVKSEKGLKLCSEQIGTAEGGYARSYDTLINGESYRIVKVFMPRGYAGSPEDLGAPASGEYESLSVDEKEEGFYGTYYIRIPDETAEQPDQDTDGSTDDNADDNTDEKSEPETSVKAKHYSDKKIDGYLVRSVFLPRDYQGSLKDLGVPDEGDYERKEVYETEEGFYASYFIPLNKKSQAGEDDNEDSDEEYSGDMEEISENAAASVSGNQFFTRIARFSDGFEDEGIVLEDIGHSMEDADAVEIIRHTLEKLPISMINGYNTYDGDLFSAYTLGE